jgi:hypothetical protein
MKYIIIDNFLTKEQADYIEKSISVDNVVNFHDMPITVKSYKSMNNNLFKSCKAYLKQLIIHNEYTEKGFESICEPILFEIQRKFNCKLAVTNFRANLSDRDCEEPTLKNDVPHVDILEIKDNMYTCLYYVNDSEGDTILFNETSKGSIFYDDIPEELTVLEKISPRKNRFVLFKSENLHSAPAYTRVNRYVFNMNITTDKEIL